MKWLCLFLIALCGLCGYLSYRLWFNPMSGTHLLLQLEQQLAAEQKENERLRTRNNNLELNINSLKTDFDAREEVARKNLGLIQKDETFFHISTEPDDSDQY